MVTRPASEYHADKGGGRRILFVVNSLTGGGAERVTVALARFLVNQGHSVGVVTMNGSQRDFYVLPEEVDRVCLNLARETRGLEKLLVNWRRVYGLRRVLRRERADVLLGMMTTSAVLCILSAWGMRIRVVVSERNYPGRKPCARPWAILRSLFYRFADAHVAQTEKTADWLRAHTGAQSIYVIPNSVAWPIPDYPPAIAPGTLVDKNDHLLLAVGTKAHQKGFDLLLDSFAGVAQKHPTWRLVILGISSASNEGQALVDQATELGVEGQFMLAGRVGNVSAWYRRADLFVLSSRYEGFPNVLLEAMAAGCACVAFNCDTGPSEIIEQDVDGVLVPAEDEGALREKLDEMMGDEGKRERLGASAVRVRERFGEARLMSEWSKVLVQSGG